MKTLSSSFLMEFFHESLIKTYDACHRVRVKSYQKRRKKIEDETELLLDERSVKFAELR